MGWIHDLLSFTDKPRAMWKDEANLAWKRSHEGQDTPKQPKIGSKQKILIYMMVMAKGSKTQWTASDFNSHSTFIGYKAITRLWELEQKGYIRVCGVLKNASGSWQNKYEITDNGESYIRRYIQDELKGNVSDLFTL